MMKNILLISLFTLFMTSQLFCQTYSIDLSVGTSLYNLNIIEDYEKLTESDELGVSNSINFKSQFSSSFKYYWPNGMYTGFNVGNINYEQRLKSRKQIFYPEIYSEHIVSPLNVYNNRGTFTRKQINFDFSLGYIYKSKINPFISVGLNNAYNYYHDFNGSLFMHVPYEFGKEFRIQYHESDFSSTTSIGYVINLGVSPKLYKNIHLLLDYKFYHHGQTDMGDSLFSLGKFGFNAHTMSIGVKYLFDLKAKEDD